MNDTDIISELKTENAKLKEDNDNLLNIVAQMKVTLNRLITQYVSDGKKTSQDSCIKERGSANESRACLKIAFYKISMTRCESHFQTCSDIPIDSVLVIPLTVEFLPLVPVQSEALSRWQNASILLCYFV